MACTVGYARVSTSSQHLDMQLDALKASGCTRLHTDPVSGALSARPGLDQALADLTEAITHTPDQPAPSEPTLTQAEDKLLARAGLNRTHLWTSISKPLDTHNLPQ